MVKIIRHLIMNNCILFNWILSLRIHYYHFLSWIECIAFTYCLYYPSAEYQYNTTFSDRMTPRRQPGHDPTRPVIIVFLSDVMHEQKLSCHPFACVAWYLGFLVHLIGFIVYWLATQCSVYRSINVFIFHDDIIKWKHFLRYWPFVRGIHRSPVNSPHKGQWRGAVMFCWSVPE